VYNFGGFVLPTSEFDGATSDYEFAIRVGK
jgi:hypothetical protein